MDRHVGCVCLWAFVDNAATNIGRQPSVWVPVFSCFGYIPRNEISVSYDNSMHYIERDPFAGLNIIGGDYLLYWLQF